MLYGFPSNHNYIPTEREQMIVTIKARGGQGTHTTLYIHLTVSDPNSITYKRLNKIVLILFLQVKVKRLTRQKIHPCKGSRGPVFEGPNLKDLQAELASGITGLGPGRDAVVFTPLIKDS